jgi:hypothetical protein
LFGCVIYGNLVGNEAEENMMQILEGIEKQWIGVGGF